MEQLCFHLTIFKKCCIGDKKIRLGNFFLGGGGGKLDKISDVLPEDLNKFYILILSIPRVCGQRIQYVFGQNRLRTLCI
jgi:hypothetical protein